MLLKTLSGLNWFSNVHWRQWFRRYHPRISYPQIHTKGGACRAMMPGGNTTRRCFDGYTSHCPAIRQWHFCRRNLRGNIIGNIQGAPVEPGVHGIETVVADFFAVDIQVHTNPQPQYKPLPSGSAFYLLNVVRKVGGGIYIDIFLVAYPAAFPVIHAHQPGFKAG
jgi:hypothetical protein